MNGCLKGTKKIQSMNPASSISKGEFEDRIRRQFLALREGTREEIKGAKKEIEKLCHEERKHMKKSGDLFLSIIADFDVIKDAEHKAAVISGLNLFILYLMDEYFDVSSKFILKNMEDPDGRV